MFDICEIAVTSDDPDWLAGLAHELVESGLVARAEISPVRVIRRSQGGILDYGQSRAALYTRRENVVAIVDYVLRVDTHQMVSVTSRPINDGDPTYLQWVRDQTKVATIEHVAATNQLARHRPGIVRDPGWKRSVAG